MKIYISGIAGTGMGPLALMAKAAGMEVYGSDKAEGAICEELKRAGVIFEISEQDGSYLREHLAGLDWFVYTSALKEDHPELKIAQEAGIKITKRDELTAYLVRELGLKMVAVAGTHGKTTTTAMIVWTALKLGLPVSYIVGTTLGFAASGAYHAGSKFFVYEADEYDRNFLKFKPWLAVLPFVSYDHPDIYPTRGDYEAAFLQFKSQSEKVIEPADVVVRSEDFKLAGRVRRLDAALAATAIHEMAPEVEMKKIVEILNGFPGVGRRFEKLADGIYTDYAHHPEEIAATIDVAKEEAKLNGKKKVVVIYEPHQNTRQHEVLDEYLEAFRSADRVYWLPTYLTRENPALEVLKPEDFVAKLDGVVEAEAMEMDEDLRQKILEHQKAGDLVVLMTAGPADVWLRQNLA